MPGALRPRILLPPPQPLRTCKAVLDHHQYSLNILIYLNFYYFNFLILRYGNGQSMHINSAPPSYINYNIPGVAQPTQPMVNQFGGSIPGSVNPYSMPATLDSVGNSQNRANYQSMSANQQTSQFSQQSAQQTTPQTFPTTQQSSGFAEISSGQQQPAQSALTAIAQGSGMIPAPQPTMLSSQTMQQNMGFTR